MDPPRTTSVKPARTVLVVEDDPLVRSVAVNHLQNCGLSVIEAATGEEAVALIRNDPRVAAVFSDIQMPGSIDGIGLARWLARERPTVKVLLTSGRMGSEGLDWPLVAKPYRLDELEHEVRSLLDSSLP
jgi:two-component system, response regulator PdtaR